MDTSLDAAARPQRQTVTEFDLRSGRRARINEREASALIGKTVYTLQRDRWQGKGLPFQKDENGRVWYLAADVLAVLDKPRHSGTHEYDTTEAVQRLEKARASAALRRSS